VTDGAVSIETYLDGQGGCDLVILPSYGRDGGEDFDAVDKAGWVSRTP
jgi:hypothetical protein